jgi:hypothetical protein
MENNNFNLKGKFSGGLDYNNNKIYYETSLLRLPDRSIGKLMFDYGQLAAYFARENNTCIVELEGVNNINSFYLRDCEIISN